MSSWKLLQQLIVFWDAVDNPIFMRETERPPVWRGVAAWLERSSGITLTLGGLSCYMLTLLMFYLNNLLLLIMPALLLWTLMIGLTLAPTIVMERQQRTWEILRAVPLSLETIVLGKAGGALWWVRGVIRIMSGIMVILAIGIGLVSLILVPLTINGGTSSIPDQLLCVLAILMPLTSAIMFILDRAQQFVLTVVAALTASASSSTIRTALSAASVAVLVAWVADISVAGLLLVFARTTSTPPLLTLATLGPVVGFMTKLSLTQTLLYIAITLTLREVAVRVLWQWTMRSAHRL